MQQLVSTRSRSPPSFLHRALTTALSAAAVPVDGPFRPGNSNTTGGSGIKHDGTTTPIAPYQAKSHQQHPHSPSSFVSESTVDNAAAVSNHNAAASSVAAIAALRSAVATWCDAGPDAQGSNAFLGRCADELVGSIASALQTATTTATGGGWTQSSRTSPPRGSHVVAHYHPRRSSVSILSEKDSPLGGAAAARTSLSSSATSDMAPAGAKVGSSFNGGDRRRRETTQSNADADHGDDDVPATSRSTVVVNHSNNYSTRGATDLVGNLAGNKILTEVGGSATLATTANGQSHHLQVEGAAGNNHTPTASSSRHSVSSSDAPQQTQYRGNPLETDHSDESAAAASTMSHKSPLLAVMTSDAARTDGGGSSGGLVNGGQQQQPAATSADAFLNLGESSLTASSLQPRSPSKRDDGVAANGQQQQQQLVDSQAAAVALQFLRSLVRSVLHIDRRGSVDALTNSAFLSSTTASLSDDNTHGEKPLAAPAGGFLFATKNVGRRRSSSVSASSTTSSARPHDDGYGVVVASSAAAGVTYGDTSSMTSYSAVSAKEQSPNAVIGVMDAASETASRATTTASQKLRMSALRNFSTIPLVAAAEQALAAFAAFDPDDPAAYGSQTSMAFHTSFAPSPSPVMVAPRPPDAGVPHSSSSPHRLSRYESAVKTTAIPDTAKNGAPLAASSFNPHASLVQAQPPRDTTAVGVVHYAQQPHAGGGGVKPNVSTTSMPELSASAPLIRQLPHSDQGFDVFSQHKSMTLGSMTYRQHAGGFFSPGASIAPGASSTDVPVAYRLRRRSDASGHHNFVIEPVVHTNTAQRVQEEGDLIVGGFTVNQYLLVQMIGRGVQGEVYLAFDTTNGKEVAVKIIPRPRKIGMGGVNRLRQHVAANRIETQVYREVAILKRCQHRNVIVLYEVIDDPEHDELYLVLQLAKNGCLLKLNPKGEASRTFNFETTVRYARQLCAGLRYLHNNGIVHHDIKPENILMGDEDHVYLSDFGVSRVLSDNDYPQQQGTVAFLPPEALRMRTSVNSSHHQQPQRNPFVPGLSFSTPPPQDLHGVGPPPTASATTGGRGGNDPIINLLPVETAAAASGQGQNSVDPKAVTAGSDESSHMQTQGSAGDASTLAMLSAIQQGELMKGDVWALGLTILVMVQGKLPWSLVPDGSADSGPSPLIAFMQRVASATTVPIDESRVDARLVSILRRMLDVDPTTRWTADEAHEAFRSLMYRLERERFFRGLESHAKAAAVAPHSQFATATTSRVAYPLTHQPQQQQQQQGPVVVGGGALSSLIGMDSMTLSAGGAEARHYIYAPPHAASPLPAAATAAPVVADSAFVMGPPSALMATAANDENHHQQGDDSADGGEAARFEQEALGSITHAARVGPRGIPSLRVTDYSGV